MESPTYYFFVVNRDRKTRLRYRGHFVPRVGDTLVIGAAALTVTDVIVESARDGGGGVQHALYVHVTATGMPLLGDDCEDLELNEFCSRIQ